MPEDIAEPAPAAPEPEQAEQPAYPQIAVNLTPDGLRVSVLPAPVHVTINDHGMDQLVEGWLERHPVLLASILRKHIDIMREAQTGLQIVGADGMLTPATRKRKAGKA